MRLFRYFLICLVFLPASIFADDKECRFCRGDHKKICDGECAEVSKPGPDRMKCHRECIKTKCATDCTPKKAPVEEAQEQKKSPAAEVEVTPAKMEENS